MITSEERSDAYEQGIASAVAGDRASLWTALPGQIVTFDPTKQTATVQPTVQMEQTMPDGSKKLLTMPILLDCPVQFPRGGQCVLTFPVAPGDECLVIFASRCIDAWWQNSGVQPQVEFRMQDLSDGFALVGFSSVPNVVPNISATATELRALNRNTRISLDPAAQTVSIVAPGGATITANVTITGNLMVSGKITTADLTATGNVALGGTGGNFVQTSGGTATKVKAT